MPREASFLSMADGGRGKCYTEQKYRLRWPLVRIFSRSQSRRLVGLLPSGGFAVERGWAAPSWRRGDGRSSQQGARARGGAASRRNVRWVSHSRGGGSDLAAGREEQMNEETL
jgi:hypothetical protein